MKLQSLQMPNLAKSIAETPRRPEIFLAIFLIGMFLLSLSGLLQFMNMHAASWIAFLAILITPGFLVTHMITDRTSLDWLQRLSLALPVGITIVAIPGLPALLMHWTFERLLLGWVVTNFGVIVLWGFYFWKTGRLVAGEVTPWKWHEIVAGLFLLGAFVIAFPALTAYQIDGDNLTFLTKVTDALGGIPINLHESIFGTDMEVGVRSAVSQFLPLWILWTHLTQLDSVTLTAYTTRTMLAVWTILATYTLGKEVGNGKREFGLLAASVQMLIYLAEIFFRSDNVSLFFLIRTNADKYTVSVTMLPVVAAMAMHFLRTHQLASWGIGLLAAFAVSSIHPLIAAMTALALGAFGGAHLLLNLLSKETWKRVILVGIMAGVTMFLPIVLLFMSRGSHALAPTYPRSFEGWQLGEEQVPVFPSLRMTNLDVYGPLPTLETLVPEDAEANTSPFLVWRYFFNMRRRRLIISELNEYVSDPSLVIEPPYLLALALIPFLAFHMRKHIGVQYVVSVTLAMMFFMYNPIVTPIIGSLVVPWLLWRFIWMMPYVFAITLALSRGISLLARWIQKFRGDLNMPMLRGAGVVLFLLSSTIALSGNIETTIKEVVNAEAGPRTFPAPYRILEFLSQQTSLSATPVMVAASQDLSVSIPVYAANAGVIGHRVFNISEFFPADEQNIALARLIDQNYLINAPFLTENSIDILARYQIKYLVVQSATNLDFQLRLASPWIAWKMDDQIFSLYEVLSLPTNSKSIQGNSHLVEYEWKAAEEQFLTALNENPSDHLALAGLASVLRIEGRFEEAVATLERLAQSAPFPAVYYQLGNLNVGMGKFDLAATNFRQATDGAPEVFRYQVALADTCLRLQQVDCASIAFEQAATLQEPVDESRRMIVLAGLWLQRGEDELALSLYEKGVDLRPNTRNRYLLSAVYQNTEHFDQAQAILNQMQREASLEPETYFRLARLSVLQNQFEEAIAFYHKALDLQNLQAEDDTQTRLALIQTYLDAGYLAEAETNLLLLQKYQPYNATAYMLSGNLYLAQERPTEAIAAYQKALEIDPTAITAYISLSDQFQEQAFVDENVDLLSTAIEANPNQPGIFISWGNQLQQLGDNEGALEAYQIALNLLDAASLSSRVSQQSINRDRAIVYSRLASLYEEQGKIHIALDYYSSATVVNPTDSLRWVEYGNALRGQNRLDEAESAYRQAIQTNTTFLLAYLQLADLLQARGKFDQATTTYEEAINVYLSQPQQLPRAVAQLTLDNLSGQYAEIELAFGSATDSEIPNDSLLMPNEVDILDTFLQALEAGNTPSTIRALARIYQRMDQEDKAIALYQTSIQDGEENNLSPATLSQYYSGLGDIYTAQLVYDQAIEAYEKAVSLNAYALPPRLGLANVYALQGQLDNAIRELSRAIEFFPGSIDAQLALANIFTSQGESQQAFEVYQTLAYDHPGNTAAAIALARAYQQRGDLAEAKNIYSQIIESHPGLVDAYIGLANLHIETTRYDEAEYQLQLALQIDQSDADIYLTIGALQNRQLKYFDAIDAYTRAIELDPRRQDAYLRLADIHRTLGFFENAINILNLAVQADPTGVDALMMMATLLQEQSRPEQAEQALHLALQRSPGNPLVRGILANFYRIQNKPELALEQYRLSAEEHPANLEVLVAYANELNRQGYPTQAEKLYKQVEQSSQPTLSGLRALASTTPPSGDLVYDINLLERALEMSPTDVAALLQLGRLQMVMGNTTHASQTFRKAIEIAPSQGNVWTALGDLQLSSGLREDAIHSFETAIAVDPGYIPAYNSLLQAYPTHQYPFQAAKILTQARQAVPGNYQVDLLEAQFHITQQQWNAAETALLLAIQKAPGLAEPYLALAGLYVRLGQYPDAITLYAEAGEHEPGNPNIYISLARVYETLGETENAFEALNLAIQKDATRTDAYLALSNLYLQQNQANHAEQTLLRALIHAPGNGLVRAALASLYRSQGNLEGAIEQTRLSAHENPTSIEALIAYANDLWYAKQFSTAEELYTQAEETSHPTPAGLRALSTARQGQAKFTEATHLLLQAIDLAPSDAATWTQLGRLYLDLDNVESAIEAFQKATELAPDQPPVWLALGEVQLNLGKREDAIASFEQALKIEPTFVPAFGSLLDAYPVNQYPDEVIRILEKAQAAAPGDYRIDLYRGRVFQEQLLWEDARLAFEAAIHQAPGILDGYLSLGELAMRSGEYTEAITLYQQAIEIFPGNGRIYAGLAMAYSSQGNIPQALGILNSGLVAHPSSFDILLALASLYQTLNTPSQAEITLQTAIALYPGNITIRQSLSGFYQLRNLNQLSLKFARLTWEERPTSMEALVAYANELHLLGEVEQAESFYLQAGQMPPTPAGLRALASAHAENGNYETAITLLREAINLAPNDVSSWVQLGQTQFNLGDTTNAIISLEQAKSLAPNQARIWQILGSVQLVLGQNRSAIESLNRAIEIEPTDLETYGVLLEIYPVEIYADKAAEIITDAQKVVPGSHIPDIYETRYHQELFEWIEAENAIQRALAKAPGQIEIYIAWGNLLTRMGRNGEAAIAFEKALLIEPGNIAVQNMLTLIFERNIPLEDDQIEVKLDVLSVLALIYSEAGEHIPLNWLPLQHSPSSRYTPSLHSPIQDTPVIRFLP